MVKDVKELSSLVFLEWYIMNSYVKFEINDVAISKSLWLLEKIF